MSNTKPSTSKTEDFSNLSDDEVAELEASQSSGRHGGGAPRKAKAFWPSFKRLALLFGAEKFSFSCAVIMMALSVALNVIAPLVLGQAMNVIFAGATGHTASSTPTSVLGFELPGTPTAGSIDFFLLSRLILVVIVMYLVANALHWWQGLIVNALGMRIVYRLRERIEAKINRLPLGWFDARQRGDLLSRTTNDVDNVQTAIQQGLPNILSGVLTVLGITVMMFSLSWQLALIALIAIPISGVVVGIIGSKSQKLFTAQWMHTGRLNGHIEESFTGHELVQLYGRSDYMQATFDERNEQLFQASFKAQFYSGMIHPIMQWVTHLGYVGIAVVGGLRVASGAMSLGAVTAFIQYSREFNQPLGQLAGMSNIVISAVASAERIFEFLDAEEEDHPAADSTGAHQEVETTRGKIEFRNVEFSYTEDTPLITNLTMTAEPGNMVAIVGPTGAGKTTLVNLIMRFYELNSGTILLDGQDISTMDRAALRERIGMVLQDAVLFGGTIVDNIRYGNLDATDEQVIDAAKATYVDRFVTGLPNGYDTEVSLDSDAISAGERQLITIARAFLSDPALLILDEATSSVDTRTEKLIQEAMAALQKDRTTFVIAHRLSTIRQADSILVMVDGDLVEQGTHDELLSARGHYFDLYMSQFQEGAEEDEVAGQPEAAEGDLSQQP